MGETRQGKVVAWASLLCKDIWKADAAEGNAVIKHNNQAIINAE